MGTDDKPRAMSSLFEHCRGAKEEDNSQVTEPLREEILKGDVHTIEEMKAWLKPFGYSDAINDAAINFILREFVMSKISSDSIMNMDMVVNILRPQLEHQTSYFSHQPSLRLYHHRDLIGSPSSFIKAI